ncbi:conserved hypothetical protein [Burkholderiales bacterium]|nr:conserved hypothetical protein [Burkholderiales bacterium]
MPNRLATESSPYLQQHADNPVDWYPWGEEAFARARAANKPVHLSVGYFACHWCHVMAHECFEDPEIARVLNDDFVNIKVDRQERPDIDDLYQRVVQMMGQSGGWPLTVFLTPEQEPFFAGTYFAPEDRPGRPGFPRLLRGLSQAWRNRQDEVRENCKQFLRGFQVHDEQLLAAADPPQVDGPGEAARAFARNTDPVYGGLGRAPKFPNPSCSDLMLRVYRRTREPQLLAAVERTLEHMAGGGIYDHLGGGFARYSVDERWTIPHFEKMLYDNGQLVKLYADAYRLTGRPAWRRVFEECIAYVLRDLTHPEGGFYASEDADSEGEEGRFYAWSPRELHAILGEDDAAFACRAYGIGERGNFAQDRSVLQRSVALEEPEELRLEGVRQRLFAARLRRVRPGRDENVLTAWNALMIQGLCAAYQAGGAPAHLRAARASADFLATHLASADGGLYRAWRGGVAKVPGFLDDYGFLANALLDLYESAFDKRDLDRSLELVDQVLENFWDDGLYFTPRNGASLIHRPLAPFDGAWPSGTSQSVLALLRAHEMSGRQRYFDCAQRVLAQFDAAAARDAFGFAHLLAAQEFARVGPVTVVFCGGREHAASLIETAHRQYLPSRVLALAEHVPLGEGRGLVDGKPAAYVCQNQFCLPPVTSAAGLRDCLA